MQNIYKIIKQIKSNFELSNFYLLIANLFSLAIAILNFKLITHYLTTVDLSSYVLIITFQSFSTLILTGPLRVGLIRLFSNALYNNVETHYIKFALLMISLGWFIAVILGVTISLFLTRKIPISLIGIVCAITYGALLDYTDFLAGSALQRGNKKLASILMLIGKLALTIGIFLSLKILTRVEPVSILFLTLITFFVILLLIYSLSKIFILQKISNSKLYYNWSKDLMKLIWIFTLIGIISWAQTSLPKFFLSWYQSSDSISQFYVVSQIALMGILVIVSTIGQSISPRLFLKQEKHADLVLSPWQPELIVGASIIISFALCGMLISYFFGDWIIQIITRKNFSNLNYLLSVMFVAYGFYGTAQVFRIYGDQIKRPKIYLKANLIYPIMTIVLTFIAAQFNLKAICYAILIGELTHLSLILILNKNYYEKKVYNE